MRRIHLLLICLIHFTCFAQREHVTKGDFYFSKKMYHEAIGEYKMALEEDMVVNKGEITSKIAKTYTYLFDYENAANAYQELVQLREPDASAHYEYGQVLRSLGKYDEALEQFKKFIMNGHPELESVLLSQCKWPKEKHKSDFEFHLAKTNIETGGRSFGQSFYQGGLLFSTPQSSDWQENTVYYDLTIASTRDSVNFADNNKLPGDINHLYYEGTPFVSSDGKTLYYAANSSTVKKIKKKKKGELDIREDGLNILKIFVSHKTKDGWSEPRSLNINSNSYNNAFPHLSEDGKYLFFSSDRPGGKGLMDIYVSARINDSTFTEPENLGDAVNSFENDMYPYLVGKQLYFSSKGHEGFGGSDIYVCDFNDGQTVNRRNLGKTVNSPKDDFALILKNKQGYLSSNRDGSHGYDHIYYVKDRSLFNDVFAMDTLSGEILDKDSKAPLKDVLVQLHERLADGSFKVIDKIRTKDDGKWEFVVRPDREYQVSFHHKEYEELTTSIPIKDDADPSNREKILSQLNPLMWEKKSNDDKDRLYGEIINQITSQPESGVLVELYEKQANGTYTLKEDMSTGTDGKWEFWVDKDKEYQVKFSKDEFDQNVVDIPENDGAIPSNRSKVLARLNPLQLHPEAKKDNIVRINNLYFDFNQVSVQAKSKPILDNLVQYLKANTSARIELGAHTDAVGSDTYNMNLSQKRANYCKKYLENKGIDPGRIVAKGYGETQILNDCVNWNDCTDKENEVNRRVEVKFL